MNTYITYGAAIFVACLGAVLSYVEFLEDALWLARSGSVIVVLGILYTILEFYAHQDDHKTFKSEAPNAYADLKYEHKRLDEKQVNLWKKKTEALEDDLKTGLEKRTMKHEGILLMTGTLIWGFGDLPFRFLVSG